MTDNVELPQVLLDYLKRVGAEVLNFRRAIVKEHKGNYYIERTLIRINGDGSIDCSNKDHAPTAEEAEAIKAALLTCKFPKSIGATQANAKQLFYEQSFDTSKVWIMLSRHDGLIKMVQSRHEKEDGSKYFRSWSYWSDGLWRGLEPEGELPFWKPKVAVRGKIMVHEGGKAAAYAHWLTTDEGPEAIAARAVHPWANELGLYEHWGILGGALAPHRADYTELRHERPQEVVYFCDNDHAGRSALQEFSKHYGGSMKGIKLNNHFKEGWDIADPMPAKLFVKVRNGKQKWKGPALDKLLIGATRATEKMQGATGRPVTVLKRAFKEEWLHSVTPEAFIHMAWPSNILSATEFNSLVRPFSDVDDTARLIRADEASKSLSLRYHPGLPAGLSGSSEGNFVNTYCPPDVKAEKGDASPWLDFMKLLIPDDGDRLETLRWCATLIARPAVKMLYGLLVVSETQGVGKTTLGEKILAPLVGLWNCSFPSESEIVDSNFNAWIAHKRLAIVNEIYAGSSAKAYNKLKSVTTDRHITVNRKYQSAYEIENWLHMFACSNSIRALKLSLDDRRWLVPSITEVIAPTSYWVELNNWLENENGLEVIAWWAEDFLAGVPAVVSGATAPYTAAKKAMIDEQMSPGMLLAANVLDVVKEKANGKAVFVTDTALVEHIKTKLYDGRQNDKLEKPSTIRKLAKARGWFIGADTTRRWSPGRAVARIISNDREIARRLPEGLAKEGYNAEDINLISDM